MSERSSGIGIVVGFLLSLLLAVAAPAAAQLNQTCTASALNRTVQVAEDGAFFIADLPAEPGLHRVRVTCTPEGAPVTRGQSPFFLFVPNGLVQITAISFGGVSPIPVTLSLEVPTRQLLEKNQRIEL